MMSRDFPSVLVVKKKKKKKICLHCRRCEFDPWVRKIPWRRKWQPTPEFLTREFHGQRSLAGYSPWGHKRVRNDLVTKQPQQMMSGMEPWRTVSP